jgi:hypothetical protein
VPSQVEVLLVSGLHSNEACASLMARQVFERPLERFAKIIETGIRYGLRPTAR